MCLFGGDDPQVWADASQNLCSGNAEDHLKFILYGEGHPTVEVELTDVWAYPQERWVVAGTLGGLHGSHVQHVGVPRAAGCLGGRGRIGGRHR
jgi:hypothetical protein